jgi:hypothetical protein
MLRMCMQLQPGQLARQSGNDLGHFHPLGNTPEHVDRPSMGQTITSTTTHDTHLFLASSGQDMHCCAHVYCIGVHLARPHVL